MDIHDPRKSVGPAGITAGVIKQNQPELTPLLKIPLNNPTREENAEYMASRRRRIYTKKMISKY